MIDINGLNAALTAIIRPIVLEIVEREFSALEHIKSRVSEAHQILDDHRKLLANLETAIETLGKRVTENMLEADRQLDIHRKEIDTAFSGVGMRINYCETRLNEAREEIAALKQSAPVNPELLNQLDPLGLVSTPTIDALVKEAVNAHLPTDDMLADKALNVLIDHLDSDLGANQVADMFEGHSRLKRKLEDAIDNHLERSEFVTADEVKDKMREILLGEVVIQFDLS